MQSRKPVATLQNVRLALHLKALRVCVCVCPSLIVENYNDNYKQNTNLDRYVQK